MVSVNDPWESKYRPADNDPANTANDDTDDIHLHVSVVSTERGDIRYIRFRVIPQLMIQVIFL